MEWTNFPFFLFRSALVFDTFAEQILNRIGELSELLSADFKAYRGKRSSHTFFHSLAISIRPVLLCGYLNPFIKGLGFHEALLDECWLKTAKVQLFAFFGNPDSLIP